jgi:hypothetical protein
MIPASASARLAHDIMMGRSPEIKQLVVRSRIVQIIVTKELMRKELAAEERLHWSNKIGDGMHFSVGHLDCKLLFKGKKVLHHSLWQQISNIRLA